MTTVKHFTLNRLNEEAEHIRVWEGELNGVIIKVILNPTDQRIPRYILSSPDACIFGLHYDQMPKAYKEAYTDAMSLIGQAGRQMGAKLINYRIEGNLHCRSEEPEPLHPHVHILFRYPPGAEIISGYISEDPRFGGDYPLVEGKKKINENICKNLAEKTRVTIESLLINKVNNIV